MRKIHKTFIAFSLSCAAIFQLHAQDVDANYYRVEVPTASARTEAITVGELVADYGSFIVIRSRANSGLRANSLATQLDTRLHVKNFSFDPLAEKPRAENLNPRSYFENLDNSGGDFLVQFDAPIKGEWLAELKSVGLETVQYFPNQAYLVKGSATAARAAQKLARVRFVGEYHPAYRLPAELSWVFDDVVTKDSYGVDRAAAYDISVSKSADVNNLLSIIQKANGQILHRMSLANNYFDVVRVQLPPNALVNVVRASGVIAIDPYIKPEKEDERAAQIVAGNFTNATTLAAPGYDPKTQFGVDGSNVTVAVVDDGVGIPGDGGFYTTTGNAVDGPLRGATVGAAGHGHLQSTIIAGAAPFSVLDPLGYNYGLGIAPKANIVNIPFLRAGYTGDDAATANDTFVTAGPNGQTGALSNNSWGAGTNGNVYSARAALWDGLVRDATTVASIDPLLIVFSAGNQGTSGLTQPKVAKNVISVAASENVRPGEASSGGSTGAADNLEQLPDFSSRGPAADGRIKPDITAPGDAVAGGRSGPDVLFGNIDTFHRRSSGTSHAAPQVAGAAALFIEGWRSSHLGARPSPAMTKAAILNSGVDMTGTGAIATIPNGAEGWGRINLKNVFTPANQLLALDQTEVFTDPGQSYVWNGAVASDARDLRIALVWTDPPAAVDPALVNNLDLEVEVNGTLYRGNVFTAGVSTAGGVANTKDNVEKVLLAGIAQGASLKITVKATAINGDGVLGNADTTDQHFALVCTNCVQNPGFSLNTTTIPTSTCAGETLSRSINIGQILGFTTPVALSATGLAAPGSVSFAPNSVVPPGISTMSIATLGVASGLYNINVLGTAGAETRAATLPVFVAAGLPIATSLTLPANNAANVAIAPTLTWAAQPNAFSYQVELSNNAAFSTILQSSVTQGTSWTPAALGFSTVYFWRVTALNACRAPQVGDFRDGFEDFPGTSVVSAVRTFTTVAAPPAPGDCAVGTTTTTIFSEDMENGAVGWVPANPLSTNVWAITTDFPASPTKAYRAVAPDAAGDLNVTTPSIAIPATNAPRLQFSQLRGLEAASATACYDGGMLEVSTDGGTTFNQIVAGIMGVPYTGNINAGANPAAGRPAWCGTAPHTITAVDLSSYGGQTIKLRFRLTSDINTTVAQGWNIDDVRVKTCTP
jgi:hypothetical protein